MTGRNIASACQEHPTLSQSTALNPRNRVVWL